MRAGIVGPTAPHVGGIVHYTHRLCSALSAAGCEVRLVSYARLFPRFALPERSATVADAIAAPPPGIEVRRPLHYGRPWTSPATRAAVASVDVLHFQVWTGFLGPSMEAAVREAHRQGRPAVATLHNLVPHDRSHRVLQPLLVRLLRRMDAIVVHSAAMRETLLDRVAVRPEAVHVMPHPVEPKLGVAGPTREQARSLLGIPADAPLVLAFGAIRAYKGLDVALAALGHLPDVHLLVAGEPWGPWEPYAATARRLGVAGRLHERLGFIPDGEVATLFAAADLAVYPYLNFEAASGAAATAIAHGTPLVASRLGGFPELVGPDALAEPGDAEGLAAAIRRVLARPEAGRPSNGPLTWPEAGRWTTRLYHALLGGAPPGTAGTPGTPGKAGKAGTEGT